MSLLLPVHCASCRTPGEPLCPPCAAVLRGPAWPHAPTPRPAGFPPLWTVAPYGGTARAALVAYKDRARRDLTDVLAAALATATRAAIAAATGAVLVPVPSRRAAARRRGGDHVLRLAGRVAGLVGSGVLVCPALRPVGRLPDSVGLSAASRLAGRAGSLAVGTAYRGVLAGPHPPPVVLLDDLVTTGATLAAAALVLRRHGVRIVTAASIAATQRNRREPLF